MPQQWGAEVLMALAHRAGGLDAMLLGFATGVARSLHADLPPVRAGGMGPAARGADRRRVPVRRGVPLLRPPAHVHHRASSAWTMMCVVDFERGRCGRWRLAGLIPLYVLWTNLHGGVLGGTMTLGLAVAGWGVLFLARQAASLSRLGETRPRDQPSCTPPARRSQNWRTAFLLVGDRPRLPADAVRQPARDGDDPHLAEDRRVEGAAAGDQRAHADGPDQAARARRGRARRRSTSCCWLGTLPRLPRVSWLIPLVWFVLELQGHPAGAAVRHHRRGRDRRPVAAHDLAPAAREARRRLARPRTEARRRGWACSWAAIPALVVLARARHFRRTASPRRSSGTAGRGSIPTSFRSISTTRSRTYAASVPPGTHVFNDANLGGYLIYHAPSLKIFMDDRCELYGDDWIEDYSDTLGLPRPNSARSSSAGELYHFDHALIMTNPPEKEKPSIERTCSSIPKNGAKSPAANEPSCLSVSSSRCQGSRRVFTGIALSLRHRLDLLPEIRRHGHDGQAADADQFPGREVLVGLDRGQCHRMLELSDRLHLRPRRACRSHLRGRESGLAPPRCPPRPSHRRCGRRGFCPLFDGTEMLLGQRVVTPLHVVEPSRSRSAKL